MPKVESLASLQAIKASAAAKIAARAEGDTRVVVRLGTCGIAAGAREVMLAFMEELQKRSLTGVTVETAGCAGTCQSEPVVSVLRAGAAAVAYGRVKPSDAARIVSEHIVSGQVVKDLLAV